jgi:hypothetical protein
MNKIIPTSDRIFMCLVGPSGCGKSELLFKMLLNGTFQPAFDKIFYFYQHHQPLYDDIMSNTKISLTSTNTTTTAATTTAAAGDVGGGGGIEFIKSLDFELIDNLPNDGTNYLLIFDDSCAEISRSRDFEKIATAGRHRKFNVIYITHNLFHKSPLGRDVELQNTHIILFKSPRDVNQIAKFGQQLGVWKNFVQWYKDATSKPFGHLLIDLSLRTNDKLRYCTDVGTFPTKFYLPTSQARISILDDDITKYFYSKALPHFIAETEIPIPPKLSQRVYSLPVRMPKKLNSRSPTNRKKKGTKIQKTSGKVNKTKNITKRTTSNTLFK